MIAMTFSALVQKFFTEKLYTQMEASPHTITSYRDTFRLLLKFAGEKMGKVPTKLSIADLDAEMIGLFLDNIETTRKNAARSRNTRLAAIRSFFRFVAIHPCFKEDFFKHAVKKFSSCKCRIKLSAVFIEKGK